MSTVCPDLVDNLVVPEIGVVVLDEVAVLVDGPPTRLFHRRDVAVLIKVQPHTLKPIIPRSEQARRIFSTASLV